MLRTKPLLGLGACATGLFALSASASAQFTNNTSDIPTSGAANNSYSENVDFADVDLDGDWDAAWADGGDFNNDQNRIWINLGGLQGGTVGVFQDQTGARFPAINDDGRDVEFVDFDNDGDLDMYNSNTSAITNQTNRFWTNQGGKQGGTLGFYVDQTSARWVGLGGPGSSVAPSLVLGGGGFVDWSCDCDFGDLDNDGDMDLVHSSYGGSFDGGAPTRIFLNDGDGFFSEFNPGGTSLTTDVLPNGAPAIWAQGVQQQNTTNTTGAQADVRTGTLDIDVGDQDGDFDLDILHGDRNASPRFFHNRLEENGGVLGSGFRDVTAAVYPNSVLTQNGGSNYEQEMGDIDGDGDLDLYGLNWFNGFTDRAYRNNNGVFGDATTLTNSGADDNEGDFLDYDNDGDLDLFVCNFSGTNKLYRNIDSGSGSVGYQFVSGGSPSGSRNIDADACDVDKDGDYDIFVARDSGQNTNKYFENTTNTPDTHAPYSVKAESVGDQTAGTSPVAMRGAVYDNAPYYITWYNKTAAEVTVNGHSIPDVKMITSGGQLFRAELPGNLIGNVAYRVRSADEYNNTGFSPTQNYVGSTGLSIGGTYGAGSNGSLGEPTLEALSVAFGGTTLHVAGGNAPASTLYFLSLNSASTPPIPIPGIGVLNVGGITFVTLSGTTSSAGDAVVSLPLGASVPTGASFYMQFFTLDGLGGDLLASSKGLEVTFQ